jgi:hypothetical protein
VLLPKTIPIAGLAVPFELPTVDRDEDNTKSSGADKGKYAQFFIIFWQAKMSAFIGEIAILSSTAPLISACVSNLRPLPGPTAP